MDYLDFVNLDFSPSREMLLAEYVVEPGQGTSLKEAAGGVAAESSVGTWTKLTTMTDARMRQKAAVVYSIKQLGGGAGLVKIAYPEELFEEGNMPQIMSSIAGNIFGVSIIKNLWFHDFSAPKAIVKSFPGPAHGIPGIRKLTGVTDRPLAGTIIKPKLGLSAKEHAEVAYKAWSGGLDVVKDDENLSSQPFNDFFERIRLTLKMKQKAEKETGEKKIYLANVTAETNEMIKRAKFVKSLGGEYVMVDVLTTGFAGVQTLRQANLGLFLHGHRAMHAALDRTKTHGISMKVIAKVCRLIGLDQLHIGTAGAGKMEESVSEDVAIYNILKDDKIREDDKEGVLAQEWFGTLPVLSVCSGGLHPRAVSPLVKLFGKDCVIQAGGGVHGHPQGTVAGAKAMRQAIGAAMKKIPIEKYAKTHEELRLALEKWP